VRVIGIKNRISTPYSIIFRIANEIFIEVIIVPIYSITGIKNIIIALV
jgi:cobalamin biosynthesis Co2+ chelatase CbiK